MKKMLSELLAYKRWANCRLFSVCATMPRTEWNAPQPIKFGSLGKTLQHVYDMDEVWRAHLARSLHNIASRVPKCALDPDELGALQAGMDDWFLRYLANAGEDELRETVEFTFLDGAPGRMSAAQMLMHVVNHATYHRGHVAAMFYGFGRIPPVTDLPVFVHEGARQG